MVVGGGSLVFSCFLVFLQVFVVFNGVDAVSTVFTGGFCNVAANVSHIIQPTYFLRCVGSVREQHLLTKKEKLVPLPVDHEDVLSSGGGQAKTVWRPPRTSQKIQRCQFILSLLGFAKFW